MTGNNAIKASVSDLRHTEAMIEAPDTSSARIRLCPALRQDCCASCAANLPSGPSSPPAGWEYGTETPPEPDDRHLASLQFRTPDVQAVLSILGRRRVLDGDDELLLARVDLRRAYLRRANLERANLRNSSLRGLQGRNALLHHANLKHSDLTNANLEGADLRGADLQHANLSGANLRGTNLGGAMLEGAVLTGVASDGSTVWPDGFTAPRA